MVEKLRRDRINSSIEQLKILLENEFQKHQPNSKLEKADVLEMTVSYLKCSPSECDSFLVQLKHKLVSVLYCFSRHGFPKESS